MPVFLIFLNPKKVFKKSEAKQYYLNALKIDHSHSISALYFALALTIGDGLMGKLMVNSHNLGAKFFQNIKML